MLDRFIIMADGDFYHINRGPVGNLASCRQLGYVEEDVIHVYNCISRCWLLRSTEVHGLDVAKLYGVLQDIVMGWRHERRPGSRRSWSKLRALLSLAVATEWFEPYLRVKIEKWLDAVHSAKDEVDWQQHFVTAWAKTLTAVVTGLEPHALGTCTATTNPRQMVTLEYKGGDYGTGKHDGKVILDDSEVGGLAIVDARYPTRKQVYRGDPPRGANDLRKALRRRWVEAWQWREEELGEEQVGHWTVVSAGADLHVGFILPWY